MTKKKFNSFNLGFAYAAVPSQVTSHATVRTLLCRTTGTLYWTTMFPMVTPWLVYTVTMTTVKSKYDRDMSIKKMDGNS